MNSQWAVIFQIWKDEPVYHRLSFGAKGATVCGRTLGLHKPLYPLKHARKFAKPCRGCHQS